MDARSSPAVAAHLSIGCPSRKAADQFFAEIEALRKSNSIFRGKVIDPVVTAGGIKSIGFRRIHHVREQDLVLPDTVKQLLQGSIVNFYRNQDALRGLGVEMKRGILFHSPPGTGKTSISLYLANLLPNFTVCFVSGRRLLYPREVCAMARYLQPTMLVFEDIDLIAQERDHNGLATVLGELMNQIDGCEPNEQVLFIINTNSMSRIEDAVRNRPGRVDQIIHIPLPGLSERQELLRYFGRELALNDDVIQRTDDATEGATPALLNEVVKRAAVMAVTRVGSGNDGQRIEVTEGDLLLAVQQVEYQREHATGLGHRLSDAVL
jgi:ATP-dependent 26S proteasome regulatory subunit